MSQRTTDRKEKDLYKPCLQFLNSQPGTKAWINYNSGIWLPRQKVFVRKALQEDGVPDIIGLKNKVSGRLRYGQAFCIELKAPGRIDNVSTAQRLWMEEFQKCGGISFVADSLQDVIDAFAEI